MRRHRYIRATIIGLALAAVSAPAAAAQQDLRSPDTRDSARPALAPAQDLRSPDVRDTASGRPRVTAHFAPFPRVPAAAQSDGGDWTAAPLAFALLLLLGGAALAVRSARSGRLAAAVSDGTRARRRGVGL
jgi:hypothetical protein